jgi:hypothetical protein
MASNDSKGRNSAARRLGATGAPAGPAALDALDVLRTFAGLYDLGTGALGSLVAPMPLSLALPLPRPIARFGALAIGVRCRWPIART